MNTKLHKTIFIISVLFSFNCNAQVYIESDPIAFMLNGYSFHAGYYFTTSKIDAGIFGIDIPESFHGNKGFDETGNGIGFKWHYYGSSNDGWFIGIGAGYVSMKYFFEEKSRSISQFSTGIETGYRLKIKHSGFYLQPWVGINHNFGPKHISVNQKTFKEKEISFFPTIHLGWEF